YIAVHVVEAKGIRPFLSHRPCPWRDRVARKPTVIAQLRLVIAEVKLRRRSSAATVLPLGLRRQVRNVARRLTQPFAKFLCVVPRDEDDRVIVGLGGDGVPPGESPFWPPSAHDGAPVSASPDDSLVSPPADNNGDIGIEGQIRVGRDEALELRD